MVELEMWRNVGQGVVAVPSWDDQGIMSVSLLGPDSVAPVRSVDRDRMKVLGWDGPFVDGLLARVDGEGCGAISDAEVEALLRTRNTKTLIEKLDELSEVNARRVVEVAEADGDLSASKLEAVRNHVREKYSRAKVMPSYEELNA